MYFFLIFPKQKKIMTFFFVLHEDWMIVFSDQW